MSIAQTDAPGNKPERRDFLRALYAGAPNELYFELRCLHPTTGEVKVLWGKLGNKRELVTRLKQADALNRDGYGVHFAPCLRKTQSGKAEAAALVPALWTDTDCDGDEAKRSATLEKLYVFEPAPSVIIDSGGGWHVYWLLSEAKALETEADRQQLAGILRGLSAAVGADDAYVKSAASLMRLPSSINTKPQRDGAIVTIIEFNSDRRYPWSNFAWLEISESPPTVIQTPYLNGNGTHPLPRRTEDYLINGAGKGSRNAELFAAACQMRDAGYAQTEVEKELVPRHIADGSSEGEALATIRSAFRKPPRDPIPEPRSGKEHIDDLVSRYEEKRSRPTSDEVREAVQACAELDPLAWAEERKRIRSLVGDTYRVEDLNKMYRQASREQQRANATLLASTSGRYLESEEGIVYEKQTDRGVIRQPISDWRTHITEWVTRVDDDGQEEHLMRLLLQHPMHTTTLDVPSELFGDPNALGRFVAQRGGGIYTSYPAMHRHLPKAILSLSGTFPRRTTYRFLGWAQHEAKWTFLSPGLSVRSEGSLNEPPEVELETRLRDYGLCQSSWEESLSAFQAALGVFPQEMAGALVAFSLLPLVQRFFPPAATRPALHLVGTTGSGKSEIAAFMTSFYGHFTRDSPPAQWGDTVNTVEVLGYALADGLFWVDDWKPCYSDERTFTRFLQSYSRGMGRGRLTKDAKVRQERPCRGLLLSTGETTIEGEASILARMLVLAIPPWERRDPGGKNLAQAEVLRDALPSFTAHFARWIAGKVQDGTLQKDLASEYELSVRGYRDKLNAKLKKMANAGRVIGNWAVLVTVYRLLRTFLEEYEAEHVLPVWQDNIVETAQAVQEERAGQIFIDTLGQLLASDDVRLLDLNSHEEVRPGAPIIGYQDEQFIYLLPEISLREVKPTQSLNFTTKAIGDQLRDDGWMIPGSSPSHLTIQLRVRGHRARVWRLKREMFDGDTGDSGANGDPFLSMWKKSHRVTAVSLSEHPFHRFRRKIPHPLNARSEWLFASGDSGDSVPL